MKDKNKFYIFEDENDIKECQELLRKLTDHCSQSRVDIALGVVADLTAKVYMKLPFMNKEMFLETMSLHWNSVEQK